MALTLPKLTFFKRTVPPANLTAQENADALRAETLARNQMGPVRRFVLDARDVFDFIKQGSSGV